MSNKIIFSGGGTMGSVSPLIAVWQEIKSINPETNFLFIGTKDGPERQVIESYKIPFIAINAGKFRRYFDWKNFIDPFKIISGFFQSLKIIINFKPDAVMIAGSFVGVPVAWAAWLLRVPVLVHQQDIKVGLANKLMSWAAKKITVSFDLSLKDFNPSKTILTGNAIRKEFLHCDKKHSREFLGLDINLPTVLITGGGTGSAKLNQITKEALPEILKNCQVIHVTGAGKKINFEADNYYQYEFFTHEMPEAICAADLVITRAGLSTLSELTASGKPIIIVPMYKTHQEFNADYYKKHEAAIVLSEDTLNSEIFASIIDDLLSHPDKLKELSQNIRKMMPASGAEKIADILLKIKK